MQGKTSLLLEDVDAGKAAQIGNRIADGNTLQRGLAFRCRHQRVGADGARGLVAFRDGDFPAAHTLLSEVEEPSSTILDTSYRAGLFAGRYDAVRAALEADPDADPVLRSLAFGPWHKSLPHAAEAMERITPKGHYRVMTDLGLTPEPLSALNRKLGAASPSSRQSLIKRAKKKQDRREKRGYEKYESPQRFGVELKFGPYLPNVDLNYDGPGLGPYGKVFGQTDERGVAIDQPKKALMGAAAFEWQFLNPGGVGPLGLGYSISFMRDSAKALLADPDPDADSVRSEADSTVFWTMPMALQLNFRLELLADRWNIPLVPYAKGGLAWAMWWSKDGNGNLSRNSRGEKALGGVWGYQVNAGGMLQLDFLERGTSRNLDRTTGINHTYVFGEYQFSRIDNFGRKESMSLGAGTWFLGLAIEF